MQNPMTPKAQGEGKFNKYPTIEEQKEHFKNFSLLPLVIGVIIFVLCLIAGIAIAVQTKEVGTFFAYALGGAVGGILTYAILRILISSQVLMVLYLEKISKDVEDLKSRTERLEVGGKVEAEKKEFSASAQNTAAGGGDDTPLTE